MSQYNREGDLPPRHGGLVTEPNMNDVLSGRGGRINAHPGNVQFRELVKQYRAAYLSADTKKLDKVKIAAKIVEIIRTLNPPGRFLKEEKKEGWIEIGDEKARKKAGQAMREKAEEIRKEILHRGQISPQNPLPMFSSQPHSPANFHPQNMSLNPNYVQMQPPYVPQNHMQQLHQMNQMNQMQNFQRPPTVSSDATLPIPTARGQKKTTVRPGLMTGNAVAFDREFNRMSSSDSATSGNLNSLKMSSMDGSMNTSSSTMNRSSMSSNSESASQRKIQILDTINDEIGKGDSIASAWDDSWDQSPSNESVDTSSKSIKSERQRQFRKLKSEPSCLPSQVSDMSNILNENDLMKESLASMQMQSVEMQSMEMRRAPTQHPQTLQDKEPFDKESVDKLSINDMRMDSVNELIMDTLIPGEEEESEGSFGISLAKKKDGLTSSVGPPNLTKPNVQMRHESGVSGISAISDTSAKSSDSPWAAAIANNNATMPHLPLEMNDQYRQRFFSDYSTKSQSMLSDISVSMNMLDLTENQQNERDDL